MTTDQNRERALPAMSRAECANCGGSLIRAGKLVPHATEDCLRNLRREVESLRHTKKDRMVRYGL